MKKIGKIFITLLLLFTGSFAQSAKKIIVINKGVGGETAKNAMKRIQSDVLDIKPDWLLIAFGMNDAINTKRFLSVKDFEKYLNMLIDTSKKNGIKKLTISTINPVFEDAVLKRYKNPPFTDLNKRIISFNKVIYKVAKQKKIILVDFYKMIKKGTKNPRESLIKNPKNGGGFDGVHPNEKGYKALAKFYFSILKNKVKPGQKIVCLGDSITYGANISGGGTTTGDTYPAWLSAFLNKQKAPKKYKRDFSNFIYNGDFEICSDTVRPDDWHIWNSKGKQFGDYRHGSKGAQAGKGYLIIKNSDKSTPAYVIGKKVSIKSNTTYKVKFWAKGRGQFLAWVTEYSKTKFLKTVTLDENKKYKQLTNRWQKFTYEFKTSQETKKTSFVFRVKGEVSIDSVTVKKIK